MKFFLHLFALYCCSAVAAAPAEPAATTAPQHTHNAVQIPAGLPQPSLDLNLSKDAISGFNLEIVTRHFALEPPEKSGCCSGKILEGHAHIYINGEKIYRAYGPYIHLPEKLFKPGVNQIMVSLNDHHHNTWTEGNRGVMATLVIDTGRDDFLLHRFVAFQ